ncbi:MAG: hypothetical protein NC342_07990 [Pseudoflavonifractor sp.]|nr:hypothetical protein [Alloprevotella sp.]MCM1117461.1 hypothetical protein [Pseudoflavonifractor sp.]
MKFLITFISSMLLLLTMAGCSLDSLSQIEPSYGERHNFEAEVSRAVRRAVHTPGIDNGSTIIVTSKGDTLVAPTDSTLRAADIRTVYVTIESPVYPKRISRSALEMITIASVIAAIALFIFLILLGVFIIVIRRQHGRNKAINHAIDQGYELPEAFFTGAPKAPAVTVNQVVAEPATEACASEPAQPSVGECPPPPPSANERVFDTDAVKDAFRSATKVSAVPSLRDLRNGVILIGFGIVLFLFLAITHAAGAGFLAGGSLAVLGIAKLLTYFFTKRL